MRRATIVPALGLALTLSLGGAWQASATKAAPAAVATPRQVDDFRLTTATGHSETLYRYHDAPAVVLVMHAVGSPEVRKMAPALETLRAAYAAKGVQVMLIDSMPMDTRAAVLAEAGKFGLKSPILMDDLQLVGDQLGAERVGQVFVIDPKSWKVVYRGALGDGARTGAAQALDALVAGKPVTVAEIPARRSASLPAARRRRPPRRRFPIPRPSRR